MAFHFVRLTPDASAQLRRRAQGPVLGFVGSCAIDDDAGATLVDLGGKPTLDPAMDEPPGHWNLMWQDHVIRAAGFYQGETRDGAYVYRMSLHVTIPVAVQGELQQIQQLLGDGMAALISGMSRRPSNVEVVYASIAYE
jgi:hypothetical protein